MITIQSNIAFLTQYNLWRRDHDEELGLAMPSPAEIGLHLDFAIEHLKTLQTAE